jgi:hypothetical protein
MLFFRVDSEGKREEAEDIEESNEIDERKKSREGKGSK